MFLTSVGGELPQIQGQFKVCTVSSSSVRESYKVRTCLKKLKRNKQTKTNKQQQKSKPYCILGSKTTQQCEKNYFFLYLFVFFEYCVIRISAFWPDRMWLLKGDKFYSYNLKAEIKKINDNDNFISSEIRLNPRLNIFIKCPPLNYKTETLRPWLGHLLKGFLWSRLH